MKKRKLGHMHWFWAFILTRLISSSVGEFLIGGVSSALAKSYTQLYNIAMVFIVLLYLLVNFLWLTFTSRRYFYNTFYYIYCALRIIGGPFHEYYTIKKQIDTNYSHLCDANPLYMLFALIALLAGMYYLFYRRNQREYDEAALEEASEPSDAQ